VKRGLDGRAAEDAIAPNLVQTLENNPAIITAALRQYRAWLQFGDRDEIRLKLADYVVTEAGFGADLARRNSSTSNAARPA